MQGFILEVSINRQGDELAGDQIAGATVLPVVEVEDFLREDGAVPEVEIGGVVYAVTAVDPVALTVTIASGLQSDHQAGEGVYTVPAVVEKWAMVETQEEDEPISALVGGDLYDRITDGVREPEDQESVYLEMQDGDWVVSRPVGEEPTTDGSFLDPATVPVSPEVQQGLVDLQTEVGTNTGKLENILGNETEAGRLQNVEETAQQARNLANTADGRVSMSDYEPAPEDVSYVALDEDGNVMVDDLGNPILLQRNEGSIWFTRTRDRINLAVNPSFETGFVGIVTAELAVSRVQHASAPAGSYVLELTNTVAAGSHTILDNNHGARYPVTPGAAYTASIFAEGVSGDNSGVYVRLDFYDSAGVAVGSTAGAPTDLVLDDWSSAGASQRPYVTAVAPDTAATVEISVVHPHASSVWRVDGLLFEMSNILGRYFDGSLYAGSWGGTAHESESYLAGGLITKVFELDDGAWVEKVFMGDTLVDLDASQILHGFMDGERIQDRSIPIDKIAGVPCVAFEVLAPGNLVHIYNDNGSFVARKASALDRLEAHGFVLEDVAAGDVAYVYSHGYNPFLVGLEPGAQFLSTTPGEASSTPPKSAGTMLQRVGSAVGASVLTFVPGDPIFIT